MLKAKKLIQIQKQTKKMPVYYLHLY